jgi:hypothetical protein
MKDLEKIMKHEWQKARKGYYFPSLPEPKLHKTISGGGYCENISNRIGIGKNWVEELSKKGIAEEDSVSEILTHELTHFVKFPGTVLSILRMHKIARKYVDDRKAKRLRSAFMEAQTNLFMVEKKKHPATKPISKILAEKGQFPSPYGKLMWGLYQEIWGYDLGAQLDKEEQELVEKLKVIEFTDKDYEQYSFRRFVHILKDYEPKEPEGLPMILLGIFTEDQIKQGIKAFALECSDPNEFEAIVADILKEYSLSDSPHGGGAGIGKGLELLAGNFYTSLAEKYNVLVRKKPMKANGSSYPHSHKPYSIGDSFQNMDSFSTPKVMPGITKQWVEMAGKVYDEAKNIPNSVIVIDNSGSMPNPQAGKSVPVLGATALSNAYLDNEATVAVYNFGGHDYFSDFSEDKEQVHRDLRRYTGGGTTFNPSFIENVLMQTKKEFDLSIVSDMEINNIDALVDFVLKVPKMHRIHLIYTKENNYVEKLKEKFSKLENVAFVPLLKEKDIEYLVIGELTKSVY